MSKRGKGTQALLNEIRADYELFLAELDPKRRADEATKMFFTLMRAIQSGQMFIMEVEE